MATLYKRGKIWWIDYYQDGKRIRKSLKTRNRTYAKYLCAQIEKELIEGVSVIPNTQAPLKEVLGEYLKWAKISKAPKTYDNDQRILHKFAEFCQAGKIGNIKPKHIQTFLMAQKTKATANRYYDTIKAFLNWCIKMGYLRDNPMRNIKKYKIEQKSLEFLTEAQIQKLLNTAQKSNSHLYPMIATAIYAGLRLGEIINLEWQDIDFKRNTITIRPKGSFIPKSKRIRVIPLSSKLKAILEPLRKEKGLCFPTPEGTKYKISPRRSLIKLAQKAGLNKINWLVLRRTFGSQLAMKGVSLLKIQTWMGHADPRLTYKHYAHLLPSYDKDIDRI